MKKLQILIVAFLILLSICGFASTQVKAPPPLRVSVSPVSWTMDVGQSKTYTASASDGSGTYISYQWYVGGLTQFGATSSTFGFAPVSSGSFLITVTVTDSLGATSAQSSGVAVTVNPALVIPSVSASAGSVNQGQNSSLTSSVVSGGTFPYTYQWLQKAPSVGSYSSISGATASSYSFVTSGSTATGSWSFELQVTDTVSAVVTSNSVFVTVNAVPTVSVSPTSWTMDVGQSKMFSASAFGGSGTYISYQWYVGGSAQSGSTASTINYAPGSVGSFLITVTVTDSLGATSAQSSGVAVTVNPALVIPSVSASAGSVNQGQNSSLTSSVVSGGTFPYTYQWLQKAPGGSYITVGSNSATFSFVTSMATATGNWSFILQLKDNVGSVVNSSAVSVTVNIPSLDHFIISSIGTQIAGTPFSTTITAKDASNNTLTNYVGTNNLSVSIGTISPTITGAFSSGVWTGSVTLSAASSGVTLFTTGSGMSGTSGSFTTNSGALNHFTFSSISDPQMAGSAFSITVVSKDVYGNNVTGYVGTPSLTISAGSISPFTMNAFVSGVGSTLVTVTGASSGVTITATDGSYSGNSNSFTVTLAPAPTPYPTSTQTITSIPKPIITPATPTPTANPTPSPTPLEATVLAMTDSGVTVDLPISGNITSSQISNVTMTTNQSANSTTLSFTVTGESGSTGFSNMTIPKTAISYGKSLVVLIDGQHATNQGYTQDTKYFYVWYTTQFSTHKVIIQFVAPISSSAILSGSVLAVLITVPEITLIYTIIAIRRLRRKPDNA